MTISAFPIETTNLASPGGEAADLATAIRSVLGIHRDTIEISNADLLAINSVPIEIVAAPGAGKIISMRNCTLFYFFKTTGFSGPTNQVRLQYAGTESSVESGFSGFFDMEVDKFFTGNTADGVGTLAGLEDKAIVFTDDSDWTDGDGAAVMIVEYMIIDVPSMP